MGRRRERERSDRECGTMALQQQQPPSHRPHFCQPTVKWTLIRDNADSAPRKGVGLRSSPGYDNWRKARDLCSTDRCLSITVHALRLSLRPPLLRLAPSHPALERRKMRREMMNDMCHHSRYFLFRAIHKRCPHHKSIHRKGGCVDSLV